jgi:hypothetical protein
MGSRRDRIGSCMAIICAVFVKHVPLCTFAVLHSRRCLRYAVSGDVVPASSCTIDRERSKGLFWPPWDRIVLSDLLQAPPRKPSFLLLVLLLFALSPATCTAFGRWKTLHFCHHVL